MLDRTWELRTINRLATAVSRETLEALEMNSFALGDLVYRAIKAGLKAAIPGGQRRRNIEPELRRAVAAACRSVRRFVPLESYE